VPDERPLTAEELGRLERWVRGVVEDRRDANAMVEWGAEELLRRKSLAAETNSHPRERSAPITLRNVTTVRVVGVLPAARTNF
jgi:hypothetical protein